MTEPISLKLLILIFLCYAQVFSEDATTKVALEGYGELTGETAETYWSDRSYLKFDYIQYAESPDGELLFKPPVPYKPKTDVTVDPENEYSYQKTCSDGFDYSEHTVDCLGLSVATRNLSGNVPVLVHLSAYDVVTQYTSNNDYSPGFLLEKDVVLVSVQFRTKIFGFLSTGTEDIPGNVGILDIIEALRWVQKYISKFGGDPNRVTLFGQYHSAAIINALTLSPLLADEKLFHQVIYQSGSVLLNGVTTEEPFKIASEIAEKLGCSSTTDVKLVTECFIKADKGELSKAYHNYIIEKKHIPFITIGGPSGLLPESPADIYKKGEYRVYPTLGGSVKHPGLCSATMELTNKLKKLIENINTLRKKLVSTNTRSDDQNEIIENQFPRRIFRNNVLKSILPTSLDIESFNVKYATSQALKYNTDQGGKSYLYAFNFATKLTNQDCSKGYLTDVGLTDDDVFLFNSYSKYLERQDRRMSDFMVKLFTTFAENGIPFTHGLHHYPPMKKDKLGPYVAIDYIYKIGYDFSEEYFMALKDQTRDIEIYNI